MTFLVAKVENNCLWNRRFYHINFDNIMKFSSTFAVRDLPKIKNPTNVMCKECILAKQKKVSFPSKKFTTIEKLEIVHIDLSGPLRIIQW